MSHVLWECSAYSSTRACIIKKLQELSLDKKYKFPLLYILLEKYGNTVDELSPYFQLHYAYENVKHYHYKHNCYGNVVVYHHFWVWLY